MMRKRVLSLILVLVMLLALAVQSASAASVIASGEDEGFDDASEIQWVLTSDGTLTVSGWGTIWSGTYWDWDLNDEVTDVPWADYRSQVKTVVIEEGITGLGGITFGLHDRLETIYLPHSLKTDYGTVHTHSMDGGKTWQPDNARLKDVYYAGTKAEWNAIERPFGYDEDYTALCLVPVHCTDGIFNKEEFRFSGPRPEFDSAWWGDAGVIMQGHVQKSGAGELRGRWAVICGDTLNIVEYSAAAGKRANVRCWTDSTLGIAHSNSGVSFKDVPPGKNWIICVNLNADADYQQFLEEVTPLVNDLSVNLGYTESVSALYRFQNTAATKAWLADNFGLR